MAQNVEKKIPDAVIEVGGVKMVNYDTATAPSRYLGMLSEMDE